MKLDARTVTTLKLLGGKTDAIFFDDALPRFGYRLRLGAGDKVLRSWIVQYRRSGSTRRITLGAGGVLSAEQARQAARKTLAKVDLGGDPQGDKSDRRGKDKLKLRVVIAEYLAIKRTEIRPRTLVETTRYLLTGSYFKPLHNLPVDGVSQKDVALCLRAIAHNNGEATMRLARSKLNAFFVWCMQEGMLAANPVIGTRQPGNAAARERVLTDDELRAIWNACRDDSYGKIIRLLMLTGCRRAEVGDIGWSEIDPERDVWTIPAERSKNHRAHVLPIMPMMAAILADVPRMLTRDAMFGSRGAGFTHWAASKAALDERSGVTDWTVHDIRRTVATRMGDIGIQPHIIEQILNHQSGHRAGPAGVYNRSVYQNEVRAALAQWHGIIEGGERRILPLMPRAAR